MHYLNSRYYDPETGRFINADAIAILSESRNMINGLNLFMYCSNNPVMLTDESGKAWWHWLVGALVVIGAAMAVVVTAGGILAGIGAVASVLAGGSALTLGATISAGVFVGAFTTFAAFSVVAGIDTIGTIANGGTFGDALNTFSSYGETAMYATISGGVIGGMAGFVSYKTNHTTLYRSVNPSEYNTVKATKQFSSAGTMEGKWFATTKQNAQVWGKLLGNDKLLRISVPNYSLDIAYFIQKLDGIGSAYYFELGLLNQIFKLLR